MSTTISSAATENGLNVDQFLAAIALKEGYTQKQIGPNGERSIYAITPRVWKQHMSDWPVELCTEDQDYAKLCAIKHLKWLGRGLARAGLPQNAYTLGGAWNAGLTAFAEKRLTKAQWQYAEAIRNLCEKKT